MPVSMDEVGTWLMGGTGLAMLGRWAITALKRQGLADAAIDSHAVALKNAQEESARWEKRYNERVVAHEASQKEHEATLILIGELRVQNKMLRMLLIHKGMTSEELDAALETEDA